MDASTRILYCHCSHTHVVPPQVGREVLRQLGASGVAFETVSDLCELSARKDPGMRQVAASADVRIAACYPRAVQWLFHAAGAPLTERRVKILNMREQSADEVAAGLLADMPVTRTCQCREDPQVPAAGAWVPWFPVLDYDRCTHCKQCLSFCLFGVFGLDADGVMKVRNPEQCKTGCPACSRVCPGVAIIFPKYDKRPINGDTVREEDVKRVPVQVDVSGLLGGDACSSLRERSRKARERFSPERSPSNQDAQRVEYLRAAQSELDIPDSVLADLGCECACNSASSSADEECSARSSCCEAGEERKPAMADSVDCPCLAYLTKAAADLGIPGAAMSVVNCQCAIREASPDTAESFPIIQLCCGPDADKQAATTEADCCTCIEYFTKAGAELGIPDEILSKMANACNCGMPAPAASERPATGPWGCESEEARPPGPSAEEWNI